LRDRHKSATREAILDAGAELLTTAATHVRMEDIAARAGIGVGTLYNYFRDRTSLVEALLEARRCALLDNLDAALAAGAPFRDRLSAFVQTLARHFETNRPLLSLLLEAERSTLTGAASRKHSVLQEVLGRAERLLSEGVREQEVREGDPLTFAALLVGMVRGTGDTILARGTGRLTDAAPLIVAVFLKGASR
jgi:AcrR family transcriptional regulator